MVGERVLTTIDETGEAGEPEEAIGAGEMVASLDGDSGSEVDESCWYSCEIERSSGCMVSW